MPGPEPEALQLTDLEERVALKVGTERAAYAESRGYSSRHPEAGKRTTSTENHVLGVKAELAIARILRLPWRPHVGTIEGTDVGRDVEVRCRRLRDRRQVERADGIGAGLLSLNRRDLDKGDQAFVLVHVYSDQPDALWLRGWRLGADVMQDRYWQRDPDMADGVYRLPHAELKGLDRLHQFLEFRREQRHDDHLAAILGLGRDDSPGDA